MGFLNYDPTLYIVVSKNNGENKKEIYFIGKFRYRRKIPISSENSIIRDVNLSENSDIVGKLRH